MSDEDDGEQVEAMTRLVAALDADDHAAALMPKLRLYRAEIKRRLSEAQAKEGAEAIAWAYALDMYKALLADAALVGVSSEGRAALLHALEFGVFVATLAGDDMSLIREGGSAGGKAGMVTRIAKQSAAMAAARPLIIAAAEGELKAKERIATDVLGGWKTEAEPSLSTVKKWVQALADKGVIKLKPKTVH